MNPSKTLPLIGAPYGLLFSYRPARCRFSAMTRDILYQNNPFLNVWHRSCIREVITDLLHTTQKTPTAMSTRKTLSRIILAASLFTAGLIPASAHAVVATQSASGKTDMTVTMPEYIVLRYYDNISLTFTGASGATSKGNKSFEATWTGSDATLDANVALPDELGAITRNIKLQNAWAIAGLSPSGTASVKITGTNLTKKDD